MFFISSSVFQSCALDSADLDVGQVVAGLSKGSFSIAGIAMGQAAPCPKRAKPPQTGTATAQDPLVEIQMCVLARFAVCRLFQVTRYYGEREAMGQSVHTAE